MELKPFIKHTVRPGEPLTAQAWNDIVEGIDGAYQYLQSTLHVVRVRVTNVGLDPGSVRVTATREGAPPAEAVRPVAPERDHILSRLDQGAWTITAQAPGFAAATATVNISDAGETTQEMALTASAPIMPDLFGDTLESSLDQLSTLGIPVTRLLDFTGRELAAAATVKENPDAPVLVQWPAVGTPVSGGQGIGLVVALPLQTEAAVEVPSLSGLTQQEAQKALESIGLVLGKVQFLQKAP